MKDIERLARLSVEADVAVEVKRYIQNIVTFLRMHRAVGGGISAGATKHFDKLVRYNIASVFLIDANRVDISYHSMV